MRCFVRFFCALLCACLAAAPSVARAEKVYLNDGRVLDGRFVRIEGVAVDPLNPTASQFVSKPILMCDDDLRRTMIPWRTVSKVDPAPPPRWETFKLEQPVAQNGLPVATIGPIVRLEKFDDFGHRIFAMQTNQGIANVIQGLTEITPLWSRVESLDSNAAKAYLWDMRIATNSIPRDQLTKILLKQIDPHNVDQRLKLVRFYMQAERFPDAAVELQQVITDFPAMAGLEEQAKAIRQLGADRVLQEVEIRHKASQFGVAYGMLLRFPPTGISGTTLQAVREKIEAYRTAQQRRDAAVAQFDAQLAQLKDAAIRQHLRGVRDEIASELSLATLDRMAPFRRLADDNTLLPEQKVALAVSGWLIGANDAVDNIQVAVSLVTTRQLILNYLREPVQLNRDGTIESLGSQQSASPKFVAAILDHMKPPLDTPPEQEPGSYHVTIRGLENEPDVMYVVQLPPEYDPLVKYPNVVTLQGAGTTPEQQIAWWAGESRMPRPTDSPQQNDPANGNGPKLPPPPAVADNRAAPAGAAAAPSGPPIPDIHTMRLGQATRQGYIVIAGLDQAAPVAVSVFGPRACGRAWFAARRLPAVFDRHRPRLLVGAFDGSRRGLGHRAGASRPLGRTDFDRRHGGKIRAALLAECGASVDVFRERRARRESPGNQFDRLGPLLLAAKRLGYDARRIRRPRTRAFFRRNSAHLRLDGSQEARFLPARVPHRLDAHVGQFLLVRRSSRYSPALRRRSGKLATAAKCNAISHRRANQSRQRRTVDFVARCEICRLAFAGMGRFRSADYNHRRWQPLGQSSHQAERCHNA